MLLFVNHSLNAAFNLALEEYALTHLPENIIILWRNENAVIIGRNQNVWAEVNLPHAETLRTVVVRRITGGGAVFHDLGNLNYSMAGRFAPEDFILPLQTYLKRLGLEVESEGRNDLLLKGRKFFGHAGAEKGSRSLRHGCILFNSDIEAMCKALTPSSLKFTGKSVSSVPARVTNLGPHLPRPIHMMEFMAGFISHLRHMMPGLKPWIPAPHDLGAIEELAREKYCSFEWNFGRSPLARKTVSRKFPFGLVDLYLEIKDGRIASLGICGDFCGDSQPLEGLFTGLPFSQEVLAKTLNGVVVGSFIKGMSNEDFLTLLHS